MVTYPKDMSEVIYFTNRAIEPDGNAKAWAFKAKCEKCKVGMMGKPVEKGKVKIRATEYICSNCGFSEEKSLHEAKLTLTIVYTCPHCKNSGDTTTPFQRKSFEGVKAFIFACQKCGKKIGITKKMKKPKKGAVVEEADDDE